MQHLGGQHTLIGHHVVVTTRKHSACSTALSRLIRAMLMLTLGRHACWARRGFMIGAGIAMPRSSR
jgi:hypothetical protein